MEQKVKIDNKEYTVSPLKMKHLRKISEIISERKATGTIGGFKDLDVWMPFMIDSIKPNHPGFSAEDLDEATLTEFSELWNTIVKISGIQFTTGESKPAQESHSETYSENSPSEPVGHIQ